jgi:type II secretory pathway pseudopilin PulG
MKGTTRNTSTRGFSLIETFACITVLAILLGLGVYVTIDAKDEAHLAEAVANLRQVSTALDLYYNDHNSYPDQDEDFCEALRPYLPDPDVLVNPLMPGTEAGYIVSRFYCAPDGAESDQPEIYLTAFISDSGDTAVVLKTMGKVECLRDLLYDPDSVIGCCQAIGYDALKVSGSGSTTYYVENEEGEDAVTVKFEATGEQLGDEKGLEAHVFRIPVTGDVEGINLLIKAGQESTDETQISPPAPPDDGNPPDKVALAGFQDMGLGFYAKFAVDGASIVVTIVSDDSLWSGDDLAPRALSHATVSVFGKDAGINLGGDTAVGTVKLEF